MSESSKAPCFPLPPTDSNPFIINNSSASVTLNNASRNFTTSRQSPPPAIGKKRKNDNESNPGDFRSNNYPFIRTTSSIGKRYRNEYTSQQTLKSLLVSLEKDQLIEMFEMLTDRHPHLRPELFSLIPRPTLKSVQIAFETLEKKYQEAFPYSKEGPSTDAYAFTRVRPFLLEAKGAIIQFAEHFIQTESQAPALVIEYLHIATHFVHRLPQWDQPSHNQFKLDLYEKLIEYWIEFIKYLGEQIECGKIFGQSLVSQWASHLDEHNNITNGCFQNPINEFKQHLGWIIGIDSRR